MHAPIEIHIVVSIPKFIIIIVIVIVVTVVIIVVVAEFSRALATLVQEAHQGIVRLADILELGSGIWIIWILVRMSAKSNLNRESELQDSTPMRTRLTCRYVDLTNSMLAPYQVPLV